MRNKRKGANLAFVLRSGGHYALDYLEFMAWQLKGQDHGARLLCLTDLPSVPAPFERVPLRHGWIGWWSKLELMRPDFLPGETVHFLDLDTFITGPLEPFLALDGLFMLRDFYPSQNLASGVMVLPAAARAKAWAETQRFGIGTVMRVHGRRGDQGFLRTCWPDKEVLRLQDHLPPRYIASMKAPGYEYCAGDTAILCCHGKPKPRELKWHNNAETIPWGSVQERADVVAIVADGPSAAPLRDVKLPAKAYVLAVNGAVEWLPRAPDGFFTLDPNAPNLRRLREQRKGTTYYAAVPDGFHKSTKVITPVTWLRRWMGKNDGAMRSRYGMSPGRHGISTGNSCYGALNVAKHLGAKRIVIFGLDANSAPRVSTGSPSGGSLQHLPKLFASAAADFKGVDVWNASPDSAVTCFPRCTVKEGLELLRTPLRAKR